MRLGQGVRTGLGHGGIPCVLQTQFSVFFFFFFIFSSPEHEVLIVSYCDQSLSVVCRPCVVNFLL